MNLLQRISLCLLKLAVHKRQPLSSSPNSVSTPNGHIPYRGGKSQAWRPSVSARMRRDEREERDA